MQGAIVRNAIVDRNARIGAGARLVNAGPLEILDQAAAQAETLRR